MANVMMVGSLLYVADMALNGRLTRTLFVTLISIVFGLRVEW
jgi:hypothetical protein